MCVLFNFDIKLQAEDEFQKKYLSGLVIPPEALDVSSYPPALTEPDPEAELEIDWRSRGVVTPIKNQVSCYKCISSSDKHCHF